MAMKLALKLPFGGRGARAAQAPARSWLARPLPLLGRLSTGKQLQVLTVALVVFLVVLTLQLRWIRASSRR